MFQTKQSKISYQRSSADMYTPLCIYTSLEHFPAPSVVLPMEIIYAVDCGLALRPPDSHCR